MKDFSLPNPSGNLPKVTIKVSKIISSSRMRSELKFRLPQLQNKTKLQQYYEETTHDDDLDTENLNEPEIFTEKLKRHLKEIIQIKQNLKDLQETKFKPPIFKNLLESFKFPRSVSHRLKRLGCNSPIKSKCSPISSSSQLSFNEQKNSFIKLTSRNICGISPTLEISKTVLQRKIKNNIPNFNK